MWEKPVEYLRSEAARSVDARIVDTRGLPDTITPAEALLEITDSAQEVSFLDLKSINLRHTSEIEKSVDEVLSSGWFILGQQTKLFEQEFQVPGDF